MALSRPYRFAHATFPTQIVRSRQLGAFTLTETSYAATARLKTHSHERACLVFVLQGAFSERVGRRERAGTPGMILLRPEEEPHSNEFSRDGACLNLEIAPEWIREVRMHAPALTESIALAPNRLFSAARELCDELRFPDSASPLAVESLVLATIVDGLREGHLSSVTPRWLERARELIDAQFTEALTLAAIAAHAGVHPVTLAATFRRRFGITVASYIRHLRIENARQQLVGSDLPLADVALAAGFCDQSHFGRTFKRQMHLTPAEYRRRLRR